MVDRYGRVKLTNPDKVLYPATGTTKAEVFDYYIDIAEAMVPHIAGRPVTRKRWPNGVDEPSFFEKQLASLGAGLAGPRIDRAQVGHHHLPDHRQRSRGWRGSRSRPRWRCTSRSGVSSARGTDGREQSPAAPGSCSTSIPARASR